MEMLQIIFAIFQHFLSNFPAKSRYIYSRLFL